MQARVLRTIDKVGVGGLDGYLLGGGTGRVKELGAEGWRLRCEMISRGGRERFEEEGGGEAVMKGQGGRDGGIDAEMRMAWSRGLCVEDWRKVREEEREKWVRAVEEEGDGTGIVEKKVKRCKWKERRRGEHMSTKGSITAVDGDTPAPEGEATTPPALNV